MNELLDRFYPESEITVTSTDQHFVTPAIKHMLRRKNRLMRAERVEEAGAIAKRVRTVLTQKNSASLNNCDTRMRCKETWEKVREVTRGHRRNAESPNGVTAQTLNTHYATISTDHQYCDTRRKQTASTDEEYMNEIGVFNILDTLKPTATGQTRYLRGSYVSGPRCLLRHSPSYLTSLLRRASSLGNGKLL